MKVAGKIIFLVSLIITVIWGTTGIFGGWTRSWIAVFVGVMVEAIFQVVESSKKDKTPTEPKVETPVAPTVETPTESTVEAPTEETKTEE